MENKKTKPSQTFENLIVWQKAHQFVLNDLQYADTEKMKFDASEISKLLNAYSKAIRDSIS